jgi:predicted ATPase/class 3 adenylate cyclase
MVAHRDRAGLPRGTVTLLFTDIEGSTNAARSLGAAYGRALAHHHELVRAACGRFGGHEIDTAGDGFFVVFDRAQDAVAAAAEAQRALVQDTWPEGAKLRARIGIHTGEPDLGNEGYVGLDVSLASRICGVAHGGQVLLSRATRDLVGDEPVAGGSVRDLGDHRLKDFERPERLFQLEAPGLQVEHPPPRTGSAVGLIVPSNRLVGRAAELARVRELLARPDVHLVTLTGPGGTGKSRLALELAWDAVDQFADGVFLVRLGPVGDPELVPSAIAAALGVREPGGRPVLDAVADFLRDRELLLVVDNVEHLLPAAAGLGQLLAAATSVRVLATSRSPLGIGGEHVLALDPLPEDDATVLFTERARAADSAFDSDSSAEAVREICRRLDGLPLAIELAAARVTLLPPAALLQRLDLALLTGGPADRPERQRTLRATIDWSYGLLTAPQRELHASLAVFAGGCSLDAIEAALGGDVLDDLGALRAGSLLHRADANGEVRFRMLEVVRQYALDVLSAEGRLDAQRERLAVWVLRLAEEAEGELAGPEQAAWLERLERELPNIRVALDWLLARDRPDEALRVASALGRFWRAHGHTSEAREWLAAGLSAPGDVEPPVRARALWTAARQATAQGDAASAVPLLEEALDLFRKLGHAREEVFARSELGLAVLAMGDEERAERLCSEALSVARRLDDDRAVSAALSQLAGVLSERGDHQGARELHEEALALRRRLDDPILVANAANNLGVAALAEGDLPRAREALEEALALARGLGDTVHIAAALCGLGETVLLEGYHAEAAAHLTESLELSIASADRATSAECLNALAATHAVAGRPVAAATLWGAADALREGRHSLATAAIEARFRPPVARELGDGFEQAARRGAARRPDELLAELVTLPETA